MHILFLLNSIFGLFTFAVLASEIYLVREWYIYKDNIGNHDYARYCLYGAIAIFAFMLFGRFLIRLFTGTSQQKGSEQDDPKMGRSNDFTTLERSDGSVIRMEFEGPESGVPLIMIHGWGNNSTQWYYQRKILSKKYRLVLIDLPGLGESKVSRNLDFSLSKYSLDLKAIINFIGHDVLVWGHSIGGMIILNYFKNFPEESKKIKGIVLEHTTYTNPLKTSILSNFLLSIQKPVIEPLLKLHIILSPYYRIKNWMNYLNGSLHISNRISSFAGTQTRGMVDTASLYTPLASPAVLAKGMLEMFKYDVTEYLKNIKVPTLVITAGNDRATKPEAGKFIHEQIQGSEIVNVAPGGHMAVYERHEEVSNAVESFLNKIKLVKQPFNNEPDPELNKLHTLAKFS